MGNLNSEDLIRLGDLYHNLELYEMSFENYKKAIKQNKVLPISRYIRVASTLIKEDLLRNAFYLEKIENEFKSSFSSENEKSVLLLKAEVLKATGKPLQSIEILRTLVEKYPHEGKALIMLGQNAWKQKDFVLADLYFERAAKIPEFETQALIEHSRMLVDSRDFEKAVRLLEKAQAIEPQARVEKYLQSIRNLLLSSRVRL